VVQLQILGALKGVVALPAVGGAVAASGAEAVQDGEEDGAFDGELEAAIGEQLTQDVVATRFLPQALEDKRRADAAGRDDGDLAVLLGGEQEDLFGKACAGGAEGVELPGILEVVEAAERAEDALFGPATVPEVLDDLKVAAGPGGFDAEEHGDLAKKETP
jgi:hypothetical protein